MGVERILVRSRPMFKLRWETEGRETRSTGRRFIIRARAMGGMELIDRRTRQKYSDTHSVALKRKAESILNREAELTHARPSK